MKRRGSSETRFRKVWCRSELCSRGERPFEVSKKNRNSQIDFRKGDFVRAFGRADVRTLGRSDVRAFGRSGVRTLQAPKGNKLHKNCTVRAVLVLRYLLYSNSMENFKLPKNREDGSDLDENLSETIAAMKSIM